MQPSKKNRSKIRLLLGIALASIVALGGLAVAVHDLNLFELDGNAVTTTSADWDRIYCDEIDLGRTGACSGVPASDALVSTFLTDPVNGGLDGSSDDIFAGAKDTLDIAFSKWSWKSGASNDKNDIEHAFAAIYRDPASTDYIIYFGLDKFSNNGDAAIGFWFLQNEVTQVGNIGGNPGLDFSPDKAHVPGDVLVQADITAGGDVPRSDTYVWVAGTTQAEIKANCENPPPSGLGGVAVAPSQGGLCRVLAGNACATAPLGDDACSIMNKVDVTAPWPYKFKGVTGNSPNFSTATFFEAGLNLSTLFPGGIPCISTFLAETRQSQSETAELEDKVMGKFDLCSIDVLKEAKDLSKLGDTFNYTITITNNGALDLTKFSIVDNKLGDLTNPSAPITSTCGATLAAGASCVITVPKTVVAGDPPTLTNTVTATYQRVTATRTDTATDTDEHTLTLLTPTIAFDKKARGSNGPLTVLQGDTVPYTLYLKNTTNTFGAPNLVCTITDTLLTIDPDNTDGDNDAGTIVVNLANGQDTTVMASRTFAYTGTFTNTANVSCTPLGFTNRVTATDSVKVTVEPSTALLTIAKEGDAYSKNGDTVNYKVTITNIGDIDLNLVSIIDNNGTPGNTGDDVALTNECPAVFPATEPDTSCVINYSRVTQAGDTDPLVNIATVTFNAGSTGTGEVSDDHSVDLVHPGFAMSKTCTPTEFRPGSSVNFTIDIWNTGDVNLVTRVTDALLGIDTTETLNARGEEACAITDFDPNAGPEDGCWRIDASIIAREDVTNTANVLATLPASYGLTNELRESATSTCTAQQQYATRTQGFWNTHGSDDLQYKGYTCHVFEQHVGSYLDLKWTQISTCEQLFGVIWQNPGTLKGTCKTMSLTSTQLLAAIFNASLSNGAPLPEEGGVPVTTLLINQYKYCTDGSTTTPCSENEIRRLAAILAAYNESGDDVSIVDADGAVIPHADPKGMRRIAVYPTCTATK